MDKNIDISKINSGVNLGQLVSILCTHSFQVPTETSLHSHLPPLHLPGSLLVIDLWPEDRDLLHLAAETPHPGSHTGGHCCSQGGDLREETMRTDQDFII